MFVVQKDLGIIPQILTQILDSCVNGVTLADPDLDICQSFMPIRRSKT